jgi:hypothetical protein
MRNRDNNPDRWMQTTRGERSSFSLTGKSKEGGALSFEIVKHKITIQSESLIKGKRGPLIWLHFRVSDTGSWRSQGSNS